jgi:hypothetical protein
MTPNVSGVSNEIDEPGTCGSSIQLNDRIDGFVHVHCANPVGHDGEHRNGRYSWGTEGMFGFDGTAPKETRS